MIEVLTDNVIAKILDDIYKRDRLIDDITELIAGEK